MNTKKIAFIAAMLSGALMANANAADQGHGKVTFTGSIIDAPCSISPDSIDQTVSLGQISNAALANSGTSTPRNFEIKLENCTDVTAKTVTTTFTGAEGATAGSLGITGTAKGASIILTNGDGKQIELGKASDGHSLQDGNNTLLFSAYLQGDSGVTATTGDFTAIADFTLAYQ
ncbi:type 1 fimbrial protein [Enterobacter asburiae]|uniref:fimbrial protein n=1 Tax=Enterobacter TaxID=547 RepID=UPI0005DA9D66|nr:MULTISPECIES: fimbrial protein [Enterobacter]KJI81931.1 fimbria A protein [Enterobacter asburiae]MCG7801602.1 type 1 fimbrial protein [Enterobacter asburiae]MCK6836472.1 type 1 fimbrial protein [Enterobacter asburiae]MCK6994184.1 type 1 fimbrial protein [Enterobacter asburiae]MDV5191634.1 fimbrial protein [Enterobacter asburiae]